MSNGRYTLCPFYVDENKKTVSCEDVCRNFNDMDEKWQWMAMYCDDDWMRCPFAADLNEAYYRQEKGDAMALQDHEIKALKSENRSLSIKLGRAEKKADRLQKQLDKEKEINNSWQRQHEEDEKKKRIFFNRMRQAQESKLAIEKNVYDEVQKIELPYINRIRYLMSLTGDTFKESDAKKWCEENENTLILGHYNAEEDDTTWELKDLSEESEETNDEAERVSEDDGTES